VTKTLLPAIQNAELKAFVEKVAPAFQAHLDMCKAAKAQLKVLAAHEGSRGLTRCGGRTILRWSMRISTRQSWWPWRGFAPAVGRCA